VLRQHTSDRDGSLRGTGSEFDFQQSALHNHLADVVLKTPASLGPTLFSLMEHRVPGALSSHV
jgi:hypothetical protein